MAYSTSSCTIGLGPDTILARMASAVSARTRKPPVVVAEERQLPAEEAASVGVDEEADAIAAGEHVHAAGEEAGVGGLVFISSHETGQHFPVAVGRAGGGLEFIQHDPPGGVEARVVRVAVGVGGGGGGSRRRS